MSALAEKLAAGITQMGLQVSQDKQVLLLHYLELLANGIKSIT